MLQRKRSYSLPLSTHPKARTVRINCGTRARVMFQKMLERAESMEDPGYSLLLERWLSGRGSTIILRDELCYPFKWMFLDKDHPHTQDIDWFNAFADLDSAILK